VETLTIGKLAERGGVLLETILEGLDSGLS
jgi:hypothetical protein